MQNPCIECLVRPVCTLICQMKEKYQDKIIRDLTSFSEEYLYDENGTYVGNYVLNANMKEYHKKLLNVCENNMKEYQRIFSRGRMQK